MQNDYYFFGKIFPKNFFFHLDRDGYFFFDFRNNKVENWPTKPEKKILFSVGVEYIEYFSLSFSIGKENENRDF